MKHVTVSAVITAALFAAAVSRAGLVPDSQLDGSEPCAIGLTLAKAAPDAAQAELDAIKDKAKASPLLTVKCCYAQAAASVYGRLHPEATFADLVGRYDQILSEIAPGMKKTYYAYESRKLWIVNPWYAGETVKSRIDDAIAYGVASGSDHAVFEAAQLMRILGEPLEKLDPLYRRCKNGPNKLLLLYAEAGDMEKAAALWREQLAAGKLNEHTAAPLFEKVIAYETSKDGFDAAALKAELDRGVMLYKIKARTDSARTGRWLQFIGMMQDTIKDL